MDAPAVIRVWAGGTHPRKSRAFVSESGQGDRPALTALADQIVEFDPGIRKKHLVERSVTVHLLQRPHFDPGLTHVDHEVAQTFVLRDVPIGPRQEHSEVGVVSSWCSILSVR
jgi:hypothetical protein